MKLLQSMYAWNPGTDRIEVGPWPDSKGWSDRFLMTAGACFREMHTLSHDQLMAMLFIDFHTCVVRDKVNLDAAHKEFLKIDEYRHLVAPGTPGLAPYR